MGTRYIISVILIVIMVGCRGRELETVPAGPVNVRVTGVVTENVSLPVHTSGILVSNEEMKLSFKTGGIVARIFVREGDRVKRGDLLASLNLLEINANAEQARSAYEKALRDYRRADTLLKEGALALEKKQNAETALSVAKSTYDIAQFNLRHSRIEAPDDGVIMKQFVKENELVSQGYPVFLFGSKGGSWKVNAAISDRDLIRINPGDSADVSFDAHQGRKFRAVVDQVGEMANPYTGTYEAELLLDGAGYRLASGFVASVNIYPSAGEIYSMVPVGSIVEADGTHGYVFIVTGSGKVKKIGIEIAALRGSMAALKAFREEDARVVYEGAAYLKDGDSVKVVN